MEQDSRKGHSRNRLGNIFSSRICDHPILSKFSNRRTRDQKRVLAEHRHPPMATPSQPAPVPAIVLLKKSKKIEKNPCRPTASLANISQSDSTRDTYAQEAMKKLLALAIAPLALLSLAHAQNATTNPVGAITVDLPRGSDTIMSVPLAKADSFRGAVTSRSGFTITVNPSPAWGSFTSVPHYVQAIDGTQAGVLFDVASNTADTITLVDNGLAPTGLDAGTNFKVVEYWTLGTLFPASDANVSFTPSANTLGLTRRTQINFPNVAETGINRASSATYFFTGSSWRSTAAAGVDANNTPILPDSFIVVRNPTTAADGLKLTVTGSVNFDPISIPLDTTAGAPNDNFVSMSRPVDVTLNDLGLISSGAFTPSTSVLGLGRKDQLLVFNNASIGINKASSATFFYYSGTWRNTASAGVDAGTTTIPAGAGIIIRKSSGTSASSTFWKNELANSQ